MTSKRMGNWILNREIGRGGMGTVYLAHEQPAGPLPRPPRLAAVKVLSATLAQEPGFVVRFQREVDALRQLHHPNIVAFYEAGEDRGAHYCAMEYVEGIGLDDVLEEQGRLPWEEVLGYALQVSGALKHAHDHGIIHRDLKPSNLMLGQANVVKLLDFGIAKVFAERSLTATNAVVGTVEYLSPEQAAGKPVTRRSDLYSLGVVVYQLITGRMPFEAASTVEMLHKHRYARFDPPRRWVPDLPHDFDQLICQLLAKEPDERPTDAGQVAKQLDRIQRQVGKKTSNTTDEVRPGGTLVDTGRMRGRPVPHGYSNVEEYVRGEPDAGDLPPARGRLRDQAGVLALLVLAAIVVLAYGLWPKSPTRRLNDVARLVERGDWQEAAAQLESLALSAGDRLDPTTVAALRADIAAQEARHRARLAKVGDGPPPPASAAERFFQDGLHHYLRGDFDQARNQWQHVIDAFAGVASEEAWVGKARQALEKAKPLEAEKATLAEALRLASQEDAAAARKRLQALLKLYEDRNDEVGKRARELIQEALAARQTPLDK